MIPPSKCEDLSSHLERSKTKTNKAYSYVGQRLVGGRVERTAKCRAREQLSYFTININKSRQPGQHNLNGKANRQHQTKPSAHQFTVFNFV